jgi:glycosyltransferase involved in cell wall biosynthesis
MNQSPPTISILVPVHNGAKTIQRALLSLVAQSFQSWEAILADDCSTDKTQEILEAWAARDSRFCVVRLHENRGSAAARNAALRVSRGELVAYLDDDDEYYPDYLQQVAALRETGEILVFGYDMLYQGYCATIGNLA